MIYNVIPIVFPLFINNDYAIKRMLKLGNYDLVDNDVIPSHFVPKQWTDLLSDSDYEVTLKLISFNTETTPQNSLAWISGIGFKSANIRETLTFGAQYPNEQKNSLIVSPDANLRIMRSFYSLALGNERSFGLQDESKPQRVLGFIHNFHKLPAGTKFLVVPK